MSGKGKKRKGKKRKEKTRKEKRRKVSVRDKVYMTILCYELPVKYLGVFLLHMYEHEYEYELGHRLSYE